MFRFWCMFSSIMSSISGFSISPCGAPCAGPCFSQDGACICKIPLQCGELCQMCILKDVTLIVYRNCTTSDCKQEHCVAVQVLYNNTASCRSITSCGCTLTNVTNSCKYMYCKMCDPILTLPISFGMQSLFLSSKLNVPSLYIVLTEFECVVNNGSCDQVCIRCDLMCMRCDQMCDQMCKRCDQMCVNTMTNNSSKYA